MKRWTLIALSCAACQSGFTGPPTIRVGSPVVPTAGPDDRGPSDLSTSGATIASPTASLLPTSPTLDAAAARTATSALALALSVEDAIVLALSNNRDLRVRRYGPVVAGTFEQIEREVFDPEVFADGTFRFERSTETNRATSEQFDVQGTGSDARVGFRQRLSTGTSVEAAVEHRFDDSDRTPRQQVARVGLTLTQALLRGRGASVNLVGVQQAALQAEASVFQLQAFVEAVIADCEVAYWQFVLSNEEIRIFENALAVARQEREQIEASIEVGQLPELELASALAEEARRQQDLIDARSRLEAARLTLNRLVNPDASGRLNTALKTTSDLRVTVSPLGDRQDRLALAERYRSDLGEARLRLEQNRLQTVATRNGLLPRLDAFVSLRKTGFSDGLAGAFENVAGEDTFDVIAGLSLSHFFLNRAANASDLAALAERQQARDAVANLRQLAHLDVRLALNEVDRAAAQISASKTTRRLQARAVTAVKEQFQVGVGTALLVAQAQRDLLASKIAEIRAVVDYRRALVRLYRAEGTLLARRGIDVGAARIQ